MNVISNGYKKLKEEFLKKKSAEKFDYLYEKLTDLEDKIECVGHDCKADENSDEIEKVKLELNIYIEKVDYLYDELSSLEETIDRLDKIRKKERLEEELER